MCEHGRSSSHEGEREWQRKGSAEKFDDGRLCEPCAVQISKLSIARTQSPMPNIDATVFALYSPYFWYSRLLGRLPSP